MLPTSVLIGPVAEELLAEREFVVLASFSRSFYLAPVHEKGHGLICCCTDALEPGPLSLACSEWNALPVPAAGTGVVRQDDALCWKNFRLPLFTGKNWVPPALPSVQARKVHSMQQHAEALFACSLHGFGRLLPRLLWDGGLPPLPEELPHEDNTETCLLSTGLSFLEMGQAWLRQPEEVVPSDFVSGLVGLGPGLTPSGDDILGGMLIALFCTGKVEQARLLKTVIAGEANRTNRISQAHLHAAGRGMGAAALHEWIGALLCGADRPKLDSICRRLSQIGHTSGWDAALGAALVCVHADW